MSAPLYILGLIKRFGPQHGYQIRSLITEMVSDFTGIKTPTIYYQLERMEKKGYLKSYSEQEGNRPERTVYTITELGDKAFKEMLIEAAKTPYMEEYPLDAVLYFMDSIDKQVLVEALENRVKNITELLLDMKSHREKLLPSLPQEAQPVTKELFRHHELHMEAEIEWAKKALETFSNVPE